MSAYTGEDAYWRVGAHSSKYGNSHDVSLENLALDQLIIP